MIKKNKILKLTSLIIFLFIFLSTVFVCGNNITAYAEEIETNIVNTEEISNESVQETMSTNNFNKSDGGILLEGVNNGNFSITRSRSELTDVKYIPNANYFLLNPSHHVNDATDNKSGTCTTVAIQMLLGYHNYYSDRRLIPASADGKDFLAIDYGSIEYHPNLYRVPVEGQGCLRIGTKNSVYEEIFDLSPFAEIPYLGQTIYGVSSGASNFITQFSPQEVSEKVTITAGNFSSSEAYSDLNAGKPIILGMNLLLEGNFHVVVAYGYAKLDGVSGFLVHYGWGAAGTLVWVPESWFGYQIRMDVNHTHSFVDKGVLDNHYRKLECSECDCQTVDLIYQINSTTIENVKYSLSNRIVIPSLLNIYDQETATFVDKNITDIGNGVFSNQAYLISVVIKDNITTIGAYAFEGCENLTSISIPASVSLIDVGAFANCNKLHIAVSSQNEYYSANGQILYNKTKTTIVDSGQVAANLTIPETVTTINQYAFYKNENIIQVHIEGNTLIDNRAFYGCNNLEKIYFHSYQVPEVDLGAFPDNITIDVPYCAREAYINEFTGTSVTVTCTPITVTLMVDQEIYNVINTYHGDVMSNVVAPEKTAYLFDCWEDEQGKEYRNGDKFDSLQNITLTAKWIEKTSHVVTFDKQGGSGGVEQIGVILGDPMPQGTSITAPTRKGYIFKGYFSEQGGSGKKYYNESMQSQSNWDVQANMTLYAHWEASKYTVTLDLGDGRTESITVQYGQPITVNFPPSRTHYKFLGYYSQSGGQGVCYIEGAVQKSGSYYYTKALSTGEAWQQDSNGVLYAHWEKLQANVSYNVIGLSDSGNTSLTPGTVNIVSGDQTTLTAPTKEGHTFHSWIINGQTFNTASVTYTFRLHTSYLTGTTAIFDTNNTGSATYSDGNITLYYDVTPSCVAEGTLITLADGRQVPVETLTGNEMLLVWNLHTGSFDVAPILFIDHDPARTYKIINLYFSDGTHVKVIDEHAFWDFDLNKYVFLREDASQYIGHWFNKQTTDQMGNLTWIRVQLTNVIITEEYTTAWSPVTYGHLCIYVNGMLSMPGATTGLINIFEVDGQTMQINQQQYLADIEAYGLFTYEEFSAILSVPEEIFNAVNGQYLKVSIGKGLIDYQTLEELINNYSEFF